MKMSSHIRPQFLIFNREVHKGHEFKYALITSTRLPLLMTGTVYQKSPANTKVIPPMRAEEFLRSFKVQSAASICAL